MLILWSEEESVCEEIGLISLSASALLCVLFLWVGVCTVVEPLHTVYFHV